jgi:hypothetical protein
VEKRFETYDWLRAIGGFLFLAAALLPWWERTFQASLRKSGLGDWMGIIPTVIFGGIAILTVIIETDSLPISRRILDPTWVLAAAIVGAVFVALRFIFDPFGGGGSGVRDTRGLGLYLAGAAAVISLIGCVIAFREREAWAASLDAEDDDDDADGEDYEYDYDADEQDDLIRRINMSLERRPADQPRRPAPRAETEQDRRRAEREQRTARANPRRRGDAGPPIP